jgi:hypothetical protein
MKYDYLWREQTEKEEGAESFMSPIKHSYSQYQGLSAHKFLWKWFK